MLSQYSWGQFFVFALVLLVGYYVVVGFLYFRLPLTALLTGRKLVGPQASDSGSTGSKSRRSRAEAVEDDLVSATSVYKAPAAPQEPPVDATEPGAGATENLTGGQEQLVAGTLPDSNAATGENSGVNETTTAEAAGGAATAEASLVDEQEHVELLPDEVSEEARQLVLASVASEKAINPENISEKRTTFVDDENDIAYETVAISNSTELEAYDLPVAASLNVITECPAIYNADDINAFLSELQDTPDEPAPELATKFAGTSLGMAEEFSQNVQAVESEIFGLFSDAGRSM